MIQLMKPINFLVKSKSVSGIVKQWRDIWILGLNSDYQPLMHTWVGLITTYVNRRS